LPKAKKIQADSPVSGASRRKCAQHTGIKIPGIYLGDKRGHLALSRFLAYHGGMQKIQQTLLRFWETYNGTMLDFARDIVTVIIIIAAGFIINRGAQRLIRKAADGKTLPGPIPRSFSLDGRVTSILALTLRYGIFVIVVIMILTVFEINTASLIAVLGAAGVAIGLALKDTLGNLAAGIVILVMGSYHRGEFIEFGSYMGTVRDINLFVTILETPDGIFVSAPNSSIWNTPLKNYTRNGRRRMDISVRIAYSDSLDDAFKTLGDIAAAESRFLADPAPQVLVQSLGESAVTIMIRAWVSFDDYWNVYWEQTRNIKIKIEEAGLHIPFPQRDLHIAGGPGPSGGF
jgi:small conductance mechanosensitive channel